MGTGTYYAARVVAQGKRSARSSVDLSLSKTLFDGDAEFTLAAAIFCFKVREWRETP